MNERLLYRVTQMQELPNKGCPGALSVNKSRGLAFYGLTPGCWKSSFGLTHTKCQPHVVRSQTSGKHTARDLLKLDGAEFAHRFMSAHIDRSFIRFPS